MRGSRLMGFMLTWFVFHTSDWDAVARFLSQLSATSAKEAKIVTGPSNEFYVFYTAPSEVQFK